MTAETLSLAAGAVLSLAFSYLPYLSDWYGKIASQGKRQVMALALALTAGAVYSLGCTGWSGLGGLLTVTCDQAGAEALVKAFFLALVANQGIYKISKG